MTAPLDATPFTRGARFSTTSVASILSAAGASSAAAAMTIQSILNLVVPLVQESTRRQPLGQGQPPNTLTLSSFRNPTSISFAASSNSESAVLAYHYNSPITLISLTPPPFTLQFSPTSMYLLVGCLGGLGRSLASWMTSRGARHFAFIFRSGSTSASAASLIASITSSTGGIAPLVFRGDASNVSDVRRCVSSIRHDSGKRIRGVVHAAMVLQDAMFAGMSVDKMSASLQPKVDGALALCEVLTEEEEELDFFVMTSSISATVGQLGQSNYAAANSVLDNIALQERRKGRKGFASLVLPMVLGVGVVAENEELEDKIARRGMYGIDEEEMLRAFEAAMSMIQGASEEGSLGVQMDAAIVLGLDPTRLAATWAAAATAGDEAVETSWMSDDARFSHLRQMSDAVLGRNNKYGGGGKKSSGGFAEQVADACASGGYEAALMVTAGCIMTKCGSVLMLPADGFELEGRSVASYGLDSMVGAELRNWLFKELGLSIAFQDLLATTLSFRALSSLVLDGFGIAAE